MTHKDNLKIVLRAKTPNRMSIQTSSTFCMLPKLLTHKTTYVFKLKLACACLYMKYYYTSANAK